MAQDKTICIVGLGYVGLPLAHAFAKAKITVLGYDVNKERIKELQAKKDRTNELTEEQLKEVDITFSFDPAVIEKANIIILAIPTPIDEQQRPDLPLLKSASETVGKHLRKGAIVVYESTVYPGVTEDICGPILTKKSGHTDYKLGYSPERVNPGDKEHAIDKIVKVVAGEDKETTDILVKLYEKIISAGIHRAPSIKVAEMSKAIENAQRDLNIAYMNEIAMLCNKLNISTQDVLDAAKTKWNFLPFSPGLVGGHCIGVDPYYLVHLAKDKHTMVELIEAARQTNDNMASYVANTVFSALKTNHNVLVLGMTFKENVPDTRNSKSMEVVQELKDKGCTVQMHDPYVDRNDALEKENVYDAILLLVPHKEYLALSSKDFAKIGKEGCLFYDLKSVFDKSEIEKTGMMYLAL